MVKCCAPFCKSYHYKAGDSTLPFHELPADLKLRELWLEKINRDDWTPTDRSGICGLHFSPSSYTTGLKIRRLKKDAVPTIFWKEPLPLPTDATSNVNGTNESSPDSRTRPGENNTTVTDTTTSERTHATITDKIDDSYLSIASFPADDVSIETSPRQPKKKAIIKRRKNRMILPSDTTVSNVSQPGETIEAANGHEPAKKMGRPRKTLEQSRKIIKRLRQQVYSFKVTNANLRKQLKSKFDYETEAATWTSKIKRIQDDAVSGRLKAQFLWKQIETYGEKQKRVRRKVTNNVPTVQTVPTVLTEQS